ncbi:hypothetical protein V2J09_018099, partial [Rumex salicifolius]
EGVTTNPRKIQVKIGKEFWGHSSFFESIAQKEWGTRIKTNSMTFPLFKVTSYKFLIRIIRSSRT